MFDEDGALTADRLSELVDDRRVIVRFTDEDDPEALVRQRASR